MIDEIEETKNKLGYCSYRKKPLKFLPHNCQYCNQPYCRKHRLPENHECRGNPHPPYF